jgi:hypothetical protein
MSKENVTYEDLQRSQDQDNKKENKRIGCLFLFKSCLLVVIAVAAVGGYYGNKTYKSLRDGVNLGVSYTQEDFEDFVSGIDMEIDDQEKRLCFSCPVKYEGEQDVDIKLSDEQATAWVDMINSDSFNLRGASVRDTRVMFEPDKVNLTTNITYQGNTFPVYLAGNIDRANNRSVQIEMYEVKVGSLPIPGEVVPQVEEFLNNFTNDKLSEIDSLRIDELDVADGHLFFKGVIPETAKGN